MTLSCFFISEKLINQEAEECFEYSKISYFSDA